MGLQAHGLRWASVLVAAGAVVAANPQRSEACSCAPATFSPSVVPEDGAEGVARNTRLLVFQDGLGAQGEPTLVRNDGDEPEQVALDVTIFERRRAQRIVWLEPEELLEAGATYELRNAEDEVVSTFEVGDSLDDEAPAVPVISELEVARLHPAQGTCEEAQCWLDSPFRRVTVGFEEPGDDVVLAMVELYAEGAEEPALRAPVSWDASTGGTRIMTEMCASYLPPMYGEGQTLCARLVAYDAAGNAAASGEVCREARECEAGDLCRYYLECLLREGGDAGPGAGASDAGVGETPAGGGGCALASAGGAATAMLGLAGVLLALGLGRRRVSRRR
jgi:hypothetical protein